MGPGFGPGELQKQIVPPAVQVSSTSAEQRNSQRTWQRFSCAPHGPVGSRFSATFDRRRNGHWERRGAAASLGIRGGSLTGQGTRKSRRRIRRSAGRRRGRSAAQQQWRRKRLRSGGFQPARIESRHAGERRQRRSGNVSGWRRQARPRRIGRRRWNRSRRWAGQRILRPRLGSRKRRRRPWIRSQGARRNFALSRLGRRRHRNVVAPPPCPEFRLKGGSSNIVTLPSFGTGGSRRSAPRRSKTGPENHGPDITVVATLAFGRRIRFLRTPQGRQGLHHLHHDCAGHGGNAVCRPRVRGARLRRRSYRAPGHARRAACWTAQGATRGRVRTRPRRNAAEAARARTRLGSDDQQSPDRAQQLEIRPVPCAETNPSKST